MHGWEKIASDPRTKSALKNMSPFFKEGTADSIDMAVRQYHRFLKMYGRQHFQLEPVWSMGKTKASWSCTVSLSMPGFPTMKATGEVTSGVSLSYLFPYPGWHF